MLRILLIANPKSGGFKKFSIDKIKRYLEKNGASVMLALTTKRGDAKRFAAEVKAKECDIVVAAGGDGTINEVVNGLAGRGITLGIIPAGTVNVFALETNIPFDPIKACDVILKDNAQTINLGLIDDEYFILMVSAGFDAYVAYNIHGGLKGLFGKMGFVLHGMGLILKYRFPKVKVTIGSDVYYGYNVIVSNMSHYAGRIMITPGASFLKDDFEVFIHAKKGAIAIIKLFLYILMKRHHKLKEVSIISANEVLLESDKKCIIQADGDGIGTLPKRIKIIKGALKVALP